MVQVPRVAAVGPDGYVVGFGVLDVEKAAKQEIDSKYICTDESASR